MKSKLSQFVPELCRKTSFVSTSEVDAIYNELLTALDQQGMTYFPSDKDRKLKVSQLLKTDSDETKEWINYQIEI